MPCTRSKSSATSAWCETEAPTVTHGGTPPGKKRRNDPWFCKHSPARKMDHRHHRAHGPRDSRADRTKDHREGPCGTTRPRPRSAVQRGASGAATRLRQAGRLVQCTSVQDVPGAAPGLCQSWAEDRAALVLAALRYRRMDRGPSTTKARHQMSEPSLDLGPMVDGLWLRYRDHLWAARPALPGQRHHGSDGRPSRMVWQCRS
jgi:hypothetical protein